MEIIDSHCHVYPTLSYLMKEHSPLINPLLFAQLKNIEKLEHGLETSREIGYQLVAPALTKIHEYLPKFNTPKMKSMHFLSDKLYSLGSVFTPLNCTLEDLHEQMNAYNIAKALIIAHPPLISNDFVLESARVNPRLCPVVNIPKPIPNLGDVIKRFKKRGAVALKIHAAASGLKPSAQHHKNILKHAEDNNLPTIIHTGALDIKPLYKEPEHGHAEFFEVLLESVSSPIILAHMNIHFPEVAIHLVKKFAHVYTDTSWQDSPIILKAIKKCGSHKILFGTDWPIIGNNYKTTLHRILSLKEEAQISNVDVENILSGNAKRIFKITS